MANDKKVIINTDNIKTVKNNMLTKSDELKECLENYLNMIDETVSIYNTDSATQYRKIARVFIKYNISYLNNVFNNFIYDLDDICEVYNDENVTNSRAVNKES